MLQEFFVTVTRKRPRPLQPDAAERIVRALSSWTVHSPDATDVLDAIAIHRRYNVSFWDAMIINSAAKLGCPILFSEVLNHGQSYGGVYVLNPFASDS